MWAALGVGYWLCLLLALPTACFLMRLFMIQPHCGHGACFERRATNDWVGRVTGVVTLTPYSFWLRGHALHHANAGNLDHRGSSDIMTRTTDEYLALRSLHRFIYRLYRNPFVMFGLIPTYLFVLHQRLPFGLMRSGREPWLSTMGTNAAIAGVVSLLIWRMGVGPFLLVEADGDHQRYDRCVVLLRSALIRGYALDSRWRLELSRSGSQHWSHTRRRRHGCGPYVPIPPTSQSTIRTIKTTPSTPPSPAVP
jgi:fatty acid desaturase